MLDYEWGNPANMMLSAGGDDQPNNDNDDNHNHNHHHHHPVVDPSHQTRQTIFDDHNNQHNHNHYVSPHSQFNEDPNNLISQTLFNHPNPNPHHHHQVNSYFDPRAYPISYANHPSVHSLDAVPSATSSYFLVPKTEDVTTRSHSDFTSRIGLNLGLGGRTYFSSAEDDFVNHLYRRSRPVEPGGPSNAPRCQAEGCNVDLTHAKHYHRRHKVCEFHSKASSVIAAGLTQRFCQQCSRFHLLSEFDNGKRSCRKRLADHNRRRRKSHQTIQENNKSSVQLDNNNALNSSSDHLTRSSPPESGAISSSSVTIGALSPPRMSLDCFKQRPYHQATTSSSASSSSLFFSSG